MLYAAVLFYMWWDVKYNLMEKDSVVNAFRIPQVILLCQALLVLVVCIIYYSTEMEKKWIDACYYTSLFFNYV